jgi:hypothetical protein
LEIGDNFDVNVEEGNNERQDFWIVHCTKSIHTLTKPLKCKWGTDYCERDEVVGGKYYKNGEIIIHHMFSLKILMWCTCFHT